MENVVIINNVKTSRRCHNQQSQNLEEKWKIFKLWNYFYSNINHPRCIYITVNSQYNKPPREMKDSSLHRELARSKIEKKWEILLKY